MLKRSLKTALGVILLPLIASVSITFYRQFGNMEVLFTEGQKYFLFGIITYGLIQLFLFKPVLIYVLGHETVHALATWICLGRVTSFKVSPSGGSIQTSKSNLFISLSPYFVPIYAILVVIAYYIIVRIHFFGFLTQQYFMFFLGLMLAFHVVMTVDTLKVRQPDLLKAMEQHSIFTSRLLLGKY